MKIAYFECVSGASGDMILGSLLDAGLEIEKLRQELKKLDLTHFDVTVEKVVKSGISASKADVVYDTEYHGHCHRHLSDIREIIENSALNETVKKKSVDIFTRLAAAEARVHQTTIEEIHFHEVGAVDAIVDIVGAVIGFELLGIEKIFSSDLNTGSGTVTCAHGTLPVPAPATLELVKNVPVYSDGTKGELLTPTGAAILTTLASEFRPMPKMRVEKIGYGAGFKDLSIPNILRVSIGEPAD